ncbi:MAG: hypothetical protein CMD35_06885 [Flavobacteriales bacterium]|nr:hypothetical protein [Flavobacteriales bacterium]
MVIRIINLIYYIRTQMRLVLINITCVFLFVSISSSAQFYNGTRMDFGKNRVQYSDYFWSHYTYEKFNIYFFEQGKNLADYVARSAHLQLKELEFQFEYKLKQKIQFIVYNTQNQSRESNIGNYPDEALNPGGFARVLGSKVFLFFDGNHQNFDRQIRSGIARLLLDEILYGDDFSDEIKNEALINFPDWYYEGLIAFLSEKWSVKADGKLKAKFNTENFDNFNWLSKEDAILAGQSIWYYIADKYGEEAVVNVFYMSKIQRNFSDGILFILGISSENLISDWSLFFKFRFMKDDMDKLPIDSNNIGRRKLKKRFEYQRLLINKKEDFVSFVTNRFSQQKVIIQNLSNGRKKCILKLGHKIDVLPDFTFPVLAWHPRGDLLNVFYESEGGMNWLTYNVRSKEKIKSKLFQVEKVLEASFSTSGKKIALSAVVNGKTDIFVLDVMSRAREQITNDFYDDRHPVFLNNDQIIVFSSNRQNDSMFVDGNDNLVYGYSSDIFSYDYSRKKSFKFMPQVLFRITNSPQFNEEQPISTGWNSIQYLSDENGIINQWEAKIDSTISFVDTTIHYRFFADKRPLTNYKSNILFHSTNGNLVARIFKPSERHVMSLSKLNKETKELKPTNFVKLIKKTTLNSKSENKIIHVLTVDSIKQKMKLNEDFLFTDYYVFRNEMDKKNTDSVVKVVKSSSNTAFKSIKINNFPTSDSAAPKVKQRNYELLFRTAEISLDLDNRFLNPQYQRYSGGSSYPMPGMNGFMKYSAVDLLENHLLTGGFRISNFFSNEFFLSYTNREKRLDKQYLLYRATHTDLEETKTFIKNVTYEGIYRLVYPFSMVNRFSTTFSIRYDQFIPLSKEISLLELPISHQFWPNIRLDYTFDNTRALGINLYSGLRFKFFTEIYQELPQFKNRMLTYGADIRHYQKIFKSLIWANRFAGGSSIGPNRLMFYLGGVDSWTAPQFNSNLSPSKLPNGSSYAFQTLATNMRGFFQNARNGSAFIALNSEIRWPIVKFLFARPFNSDFLNNFQVLGFGDLGTAWSGLSPFMDSNSLNQQILPIGGDARTGEVVLKTNKEPVIGGFGIGLRTTIIGYFIRADWAWGVEDGLIQRNLFYLSLTTDF